MLCPQTGEAERGLLVELHNRRSVRIHGFDYLTPGSYFLTICTKDLRHSFGSVKGGQVCLSAAGEAVHTAWENIPTHFPHTDIDVFVVMPNHLHGILTILEHVDTSGTERQLGQVPGGSVPVIVRSFKSAATRAARLATGIAESLWQRNYYEHVVRNEKSLQALRKYIIENPMKWELDELNIRR